MTRFTLDFVPVETAAAADLSLARWLRDHHNQTGTKIGCDIGRCGACMVLVDGAAVNGCLVMIGRLEGRQVTTIRALDRLPVGAALSRGMTEANAFQCGYCAPGVMMTLAGLLSERPAADAEAITTALEGNLCRCTGYHSILRGALRAVELLQGP